MRNYKIKFFLLLMVTVYCTPFVLWAADESIYFERSLELNENIESQELGKYLLYVEDKLQQLTIKDISSDAFISQFKGSRQKVLNLGFTKSSYWIKLNIISKSSDVNDWFIELNYPHIDHVAFYLQNKEGQYQVSQSGDSIPFYHREIKYHNCVFRFRTQPNQRITVFFNVKTNGSLQLPLILWSPKAFAEKVNYEQFIIGLYYGALIVMVLYNIFLYLAVRDRCFIYYVLFIISYVFFQLALNGHGFEYIWPNAAWWANRSIPFFVGLLGFWGARFSMIFLITDPPILIMTRLITVVGYAGVIIMLFSLSGADDILIRISTIYAAFFGITLMLTGMISYLRGNIAARYFLLAWLTFLVGSMIYAAKTSGFLPVNFTTEHSAQIGSAFMVILLSLGLADRIYRARKKDAMVKAEALQFQQDSIKAKENSNKSQKKTSETLEMKSNNIVSIANQLTQNADIMNQQAENVAGSSEEMNVNINMIASSVEEMSTNVTGISSTAKQMNENINSVASAIEEMSASMTGVGENARQGSKIADKAMKMAKKAGETMSSLGQAANEIGKVTEVIKRIADKTNLLALNAAIEAAAAGEAGKGFAVVANAIQKFADQSADAAEDIASRISDVQVNTDEAVQVIADVSSIIEEMNTSSETIMIAVEGQTVAVNDIAANAAEANSRADQIASAMAELTTGANDVARSIGEIAKGANEVARSIRGVSGAIKDSNEGIFSIHQSANELADLAQKLSKNMVA
ncbi:sensor histidine kinase [Candidatus Magnetomorum sp. HK-1]|nr:sensor histidine kinase [Candidatus Magnetomorum sp. HK-1]